MTVSDTPLDILACPQCRGPVRLNKAGDGIDCSACRLTYPVRDGIPVMIVEEARRGEGEGNHQEGD